MGPELVDVGQEHGGLGRIGHSGAWSSDRRFDFPLCMALQPVRSVKP